ncbi:MAG TPA: polysaccharide deacetylase family protein [Allosphingosinicella sp.]|nr:polysaccharide deacetylase family protein [Allosphingosinicella sp.]
MIPARRARQLVVSIHDVSPEFEPAVDRLHAQLTRLVRGPISMLVVPDFWRKAPLAGAPAYRAKLRAWADAGVEMLLHGWSHRDETTRHRGLASWKARHMTAGEGEFLGLSRAEAARRLREGRAAVEDAIGRPVTGFVAPAWLYGEGAKAALAEEGFEVAEDHFRVWRPGDGAIVARGPVISWASRSRARTLSSLAFAAFARRALAPLPTLRIAVHPGDVRKASILDSIEQTVRTAAAGRQSVTYRDLAAVASRGA